MIGVKALNQYLQRYRQEEKGTFINLKLKEKALAVGSLKKFTLQIWYVKSKKEKIQVFEIKKLYKSTSEEIDNTIWQELEQRLILEIYDNIDLIKTFIDNSFKEQEVKVIEI